MIYKTDVPEEAEKAADYLIKLIDKGVTVEVKKLNPKRSLLQNNYLHLALGLYGLETGHNMDEAKTIYKRDVNPALYAYEKGGMWFLRSSTELDTAEMTVSIDKFRQFAEEQGIHIPPPEKEAELRSLYNKLEENSHHLNGGL